MFVMLMQDHIPRTVAHSCGERISLVQPVLVQYVLRPTKEELQTFSHEWTILNAPGFLADPEARDETREFRRFKL